MAAMNNASRMTFATEGVVLPDQPAKKSRQNAKAHARALVARIDAAIARKSGRDITELPDEDLIADLRRRQERG
jgi:hypothetical protein